MSGRPSSEQLLRDRLADLRQLPVDSNGTSDELLQTIYAHLVSVTPADANVALHWFCNRAHENTIESATFLLRLFAYDSPQVTKWKQLFQRCTTSCLDCVAVLESKKIESRTTYLAAFDDATQYSFFQEFHRWELACVVEELTTRGILPSFTQPLSSAPPPLTYRLMANIHVLQDTRIMSLINSHLPPNPFEWGTDPILPAGLLLLLHHENVAVRDWTEKQFAKIMKGESIPVEKFTAAHSIALGIIDSALNATPTPDFHFPFATDPTTLWISFGAQLLSKISQAVLRKQERIFADIRHTVIRHLHDVGSVFEPILRSLVYLLSMGPALWEGEASDYPHIVFDACKDNPSFMKLIETHSASQMKPWFLSWLTKYLDHIPDPQAYSELLAKIVRFLCEELQHSRLSNICPIVMTLAAELLTSQWSTEGKRPAVRSAMEIHTEKLISVAFGDLGTKIGWTKAAVATRDVIRSLLLADVESILLCTNSLCERTAYFGTGSKKAHTQPPSITNISRSIAFWKGAYGGIKPDDAASVAMILSIMARISHLDAFLPTSFTPAAIPSQYHAATHTAVEEINATLGDIQEGFATTLTNFANVNSALSVTAFLKRDGVAGDVMKLLLSPNTRTQSASQALVGSAFDVDERAECFKALLEKFPDQSLTGLFEYLNTFSDYAAKKPEACSTSMSLVRCLTDIIDVMCSTADALLHKTVFLRPSDPNGPAAQLPKFWKLIAQALTVILKRTPAWSLFFNKEEMTVWMRDALIFGRGMLAQHEVISVAANTVHGESASRKTQNRIRAKMIKELHVTLPELARWMRLTDEELLHQSFSILQTLFECFHETNVAPPPEAMVRLNKHIADARKPKDNQAQQKLDSARLSTLESLLNSFQDEDEVEIIEHPPPLPPRPAVKRKPEDSAPDPRPKKTIKTVQTHLAPPKVQPKVQPKVPPKPILPVQSASRDKYSLAIASSSAPLPSFRKTTNTAQAGPPKNAPIPQQSNAMDVDSDSSEDSDSDDDPESQHGLGALSKLQRSPKIKKPAARRGIVKMDFQNTGQSTIEKERQDARRAAERAARRLKPEVSQLHRVLLTWNYDHEGEFPPNMDRQLAPVPDQFRDCDHYRRVFEPLLFLECWQQLMASKQEQQPHVEIAIRHRRFNGSMLELEVEVVSTVDKGWFLTESDIVLLQHADRSKKILCKTMAFKNQRGPVAPHITLCCVLPDGIDPGLNNGSTSWSLMKVLNMNTLLREYGALMSLPYYDFVDSILRPQLLKAPSDTSEGLKKMMDKHRLNAPQAEAISSALKTNGFGLIQGPPGTGKTSTICGLVSVFLDGRPRAITAPGGQSAVMPKVLICAPSNAAIDEIATRVQTLFGPPATPTSSSRVVRIGAGALTNEVKSISLKSLIDAKVQGVQSTSDDIRNKQVAIRVELDQVREKLKALEVEVAGIHDNGRRMQELNDQIKLHKEKRGKLGHQLSTLKDNQTAQGRAMDASSRVARFEILRDADVICSTLSASGQQDMIMEQFNFDLIIIDEAAQAIEPSSLIPLRYSCKRCIMVGDPQQLPPTVISQQASRHNYNQSLFVRLQKQCPPAVHLLSIQYRMHPEISELPRTIFYEKRLTDGPDMAIKTKRPWHSNPRFGIYRFFNVSSGLEEKVGVSTKNKMECHVAVALLNRLEQEFPQEKFDYKIGVVSMYAAQVSEMKYLCMQRFGKAIFDKVEFNTVDGFQGQEKDVIILSCVRAGPGVQNIGFLSDIRRMNVAITRAKSSLFILGHAATLERSNDVWRNIIEDARSRKCMIEADVKYFTSASLPPPPPSPKKVTRTSSFIAAVAAIPQDLMKPQDLKESGQSRKASSQSLATPYPSAPPPIAAPIELQQQLPPAPIQSAQASSSVGGPPAPKPPTKPKVKQPKQKAKAAPTLFIPKKRN